MTPLFVNPLTGSDANPGTFEAPFQSIPHAVTVLQPGDTLHLIPAATYRPTVFPASLMGTAELPITITSFGDAQAVFDGGLPELARVNNDAWEPVPGGHAEEWRSRQTYQAPSPQEDTFRYGQITTSQYRLLTYSVIDDLRATNESFASVPLSDPRPAGGPLVNDRTSKRPWVYMGPGLFWVFVDQDSLLGRIHVRLSHTHLDAPGITWTRHLPNPADRGARRHPRRASEPPAVRR